MSVIQFDLSDDELGYLLASGEDLYAFEDARGRYLPAFRSRAAALSFVKQLDPNVAAIPRRGFYDLRAVDAFVARRAVVPPAGSCDAWSLLGLVAAAAEREGALEDAEHRMAEERVPEGGARLGEEAGQQLAEERVPEGGARLGEEAGQQLAVPALPQTLVEPLRTALAVGLGVFREVVTHLDHA